MMRSTIQSKKAKRKTGWLSSLLAALFWLMVWQLAAMFMHNTLLLPSPAETLRALVGLLGQGGFWGSCLCSMLRVVGGFALGTLCGILLALLTGFSRVAGWLIVPLLRTVRAMPVASFIILALAWFQSNTLPMFISFLMVVPMVWSATDTAIRSVDTRLLEMAQVFRFSRRDTLLKIYLPACFSATASSALSGLGFAWKSAVAAEVICRPLLSLGGRLYAAKIYLEMPQCFAISLMIVLMSIGLEGLIRRLLLRVGFVGKGER